MLSIEGAQSTVFTFSYTPHAVNIDFFHIWVSRLNNANGLRTSPCLGVSLSLVLNPRTKQYSVFNY